MKPLAWNTLDEAASWLSEATGEAWTARRVLSAALGYPTRIGLSISYLKAAMPRDTKFALYEWNPAKGTPENPFVRKFSSPWDAVRLCLVRVRDLLVHGEAAVSIVRSPDDDFGIENEYVFIEPLDKEHVVTVNMVGVTEGDLLRLAERIMETTAQERKWPEGLANSEERNAESKPSATKPKRDSSDSLRAELETILFDMNRACDRITAGTVMPKLKARAGEKYTCVTESVLEGILWARDSGSPEKLTAKMLQKRIDRWKSKNTR